MLCAVGNPLSNDEEPSVIELAAPLVCSDTEPSSAVLVMVPVLMLPETSDTEKLLAVEMALFVDVNEPAP
jgi:hypothetical protein